QPWARTVWTLGAGAEARRAATPALREKIRAGEFSAVVDLQTSPRSRALLAGHARVFSWNAERWRRRRWVSLRWTRPHPVRPAWLRFVDALAPLGIDAALAEPPRLLAPPEAAAQ